MPPVNAEVPIQRDNHWVRQLFGHADEASIGEAHRQIGILSHQPKNCVDFRREIEGANNGALAGQRGEL